MCVPCAVPPQGYKWCTTVESLDSGFHWFRTTSELETRAEKLVYLRHWKFRALTHGGSSGYSMVGQRGDNGLASLRALFSIPVCTFVASSIYSSSSTLKDASPTRSEPHSVSIRVIVFLLLFLRAHTLTSDHVG